MQDEEQVVLRIGLDDAFHRVEQLHVVTRMLKYFVNEGLISLSRGTIRILNRDGLKKIINQ